MTEEPGQLKREAGAGAIAGGISRTVTSPLDVIKIRFQVQLEPTTTWALVRNDAYQRSKYTGILQASKDIFREEGLPLVKLTGFLAWQCPSFVDGHALYGNTIYGLTQIKNFCSRFLEARGSSTFKSLPVLCQWGVGGCAATVGSYPFDLLRTVLASQGEPKVYPNMRSALLDIVETRGVRGLYAGLSLTLVQIVPYAGLHFGTYDTFKRWTKFWNHYPASQNGITGADDAVSTFQLSLCGLAAGACAKLVCHPLDIVKKRFQIKGLKRHPRYGTLVEPRAYKNMLDAIQQILRYEGWPGLYKGIVPSMVKAAPASAVTFVAYEYVSDWLDSIAR